MDIDEEQNQVKQDIAKAWLSYKNMLEIDKSLQDIAPVDIDNVPFSGAILTDDDESIKNRQE